ncbi:unnamed protein product [Adineta ricciae]|uniref:VPS37 C-terminal domain-containing protein n=1 Tax=Adineta ricciae TaxID=249248 RepID=A0A815NLG2_ADIRI|nr:unnamed protein product [Adineta ricciae]CAF1431237.1 unnamed protein product [Adineta ricciae]
MFYQPPQALSILDQAYHEAWSQVQRMPLEYLEKLDVNSAELSSFIETLLPIRVLQKKRHELIEQNRHLAMNNLRRELELISTREKLSNSFVQLQSLREAYLKSCSSEREQISSPTLVLVQLQSIVHSYEHSDDELIDMFLHTRHNDYEIEVFVKNFLENRKKTIELRCKTEKFFDLYERERRKK